MSLGEKRTTGLAKERQQISGRKKGASFLRDQLRREREEMDASWDAETGE